MRATLAAIAVVMLVAGCSGGDSRDLSISITANGGSAEGPLEVTVTLTNGTEESLTLVRPTFIPNFVAFEVLDADGNLMPFYGPHLRLVPLGDDGFVTLAPGESTTEVLDIGEGYQLDAGTYLVTADYRNPAGGSHEGTKAVVIEPGDGPFSVQIEVVVTP